MYEESIFHNHILCFSFLMFINIAILQNKLKYDDQIDHLLFHFSFLFVIN